MNLVFSWVAHLMINPEIIHNVAPVVLANHGNCFNLMISEKNKFCSAYTGKILSGQNYFHSKIARGYIFLKPFIPHQISLIKPYIIVHMATQYSNKTKILIIKNNRFKEKQFQILLFVK